MKHSCIENGLGEYNDPRCVDWLSTPVTLPTICKAIYRCVEDPITNDHRVRRLYV